MTFWSLVNRKHVWIRVPKPEQRAKEQLLSFLRGKYENNILIFEEIKAGAGRVDLFIVSSMKNYDYRAKIVRGGLLGYAQGGLSQLQHYMVARKAKTGYLLIFDARTRDYGKTFSIEDTIDSKNISVKIIDIRPVIKPNL